MDDLSDLDSEEDESEAGITGGATAAPVDGATEDSSSSAASSSSNSNNAKNNTDATRLCGEEDIEKKDSECGRKFIIPLESNVESDMENNEEMMDFEIKVKRDNDSRPSDVSDKNELSEMHKDNEEVCSKETEEKKCVQAEPVYSSSVKSVANDSEVMICRLIDGLKISIICL